MSVNEWVLGDVVVDLLPEADGRLLPCPGGAPANVAVGIARLGDLYRQYRCRGCLCGRLTGLAGGERLSGE